MSVTEDADAIQAEEARVAQVEKSMAEAGQATTTPVIADYFGFDTTHRVMLPDGEQWIEHKPLTEGQRREYLNAQNREVRLHKASGDASMRLQMGSERIALLESAICGWNLYRNGQPVPFSKGSKGAMLNQFLEAADPKIIDIIHKDVVKHNSWLMAEMTVEDIKQQIADLNEMLDTKMREQESGNS